MTFISIGPRFQVACQLDRHGLRPWTGPLDWTTTDHVGTLCQLFRNRFVGTFRRTEIRLHWGSVGNPMLHDLDYPGLMLCGRLMNGSAEDVVDRQAMIVERALDPLLDSGDRVMLLRQELTAVAATPLAEAIAAGYPKADFRLVGVNAAMPESPPADPRILWETAPPAGQGEQDNPLYDQGWGEMFKRLQVAA